MDFHNSPIPKLEDIAKRLIDPPETGPDDIIDGFLPRQGQLVIAGTTNVGKSLAAVEICSALSTGAPLWGSLVPSLQSKKTLYILGEHYRDIIVKLAHKTRLPMADSVYILGPEELSYDKWLVSNGKQNLVAIEKFKKWATGCDFIVFDPLSAFICGADQQENDNLAMRLLLDSMSLISQSVGASSLILAHQGKPMMDSFGREHTRTKYAIRGASAVEDASTNIFYMDQATVNSDKYEIVCRKYKGDGVASFNLQRNPRTLVHTLSKDENAMENTRKNDIRDKLSRLMASNPDFTHRTAIRLVAAFEGKSVETIERWLGLKGIE